ncbi:SagB family peptide dehydrogenase, partial [Actinophytocola sp.]|uniref:SagB/ThcOx family dehydrogenase n=1 Tax=Actinophytocola sp. TaxID=1872138 RepID=UPI002D7EAF25
SVREPDDAHPLTLAQLGEFLHRSARVRRAAQDDKTEVSLRPSPSGGALHGLEIYPVVSRVSGLAAGMYHYDPFAHVLEPVPAGDRAVRQLVGRASAAAGGSHPPQVLLVVTARFGRVMWKYQGMAYALILKDLGALLQTMYLVATAMNLAPCALGAGDSALFAQATGLDELEEASIGEFMLSSRRT